MCIEIACKMSKEDDPFCILGEESGIFLEGLINLDNGGLQFIN